MLVEILPPDDSSERIARQRMAASGTFEMDDAEIALAETDLPHRYKPAVRDGAPPMPLETATDRERAEQERRAHDEAQARQYAERNSHWSGPTPIFQDEDGNVIPFGRPSQVFDDDAPANVPASIELSSDQKAALDAIMDWIGTDNPTLTMGGLAGTGKSTLMSTVVQNYHGRVAVCAYTGKAAHVLRTKGVKNACTIHSLIYEPVTTCTNCQMIVEDLGEGHGSKKPRCKRTGCEDAKSETTFEKVISLPFDLIIVDEASMVSTKIYEHLMSFGIQVLFVGDHGQLEPIGKNPGLMLEPQIRLDKIHRQAEGSAILRFAHHVRNHGKPETFGQDAVVIESTTVPKNAHEFDVVICGRNTTRVAINTLIRKARGYTTKMPVPGETVICLRNSKKHNIFNGMLAEVVEIRMDDRVSHPQIDIRLDDGQVRRNIRFEPEQFGQPDTLDDVHRRIALFDYGYCLTAHKSQGSSWDSVLVVERIHPDTSAARWRYTAATRAKHKLVWCMQPQTRGRR